MKRDSSRGLFIPLYSSTPERGGMHRVTQSRRSDISKLNVHMAIVQHCKPYSMNNRELKTRDWLTDWLIGSFTPMEAQMSSLSHYHFQVEGWGWCFLVFPGGCEDLKGIINTILWGWHQFCATPCSVLGYDLGQQPQMFLSNFSSDPASRLSLVLQDPHRPPFKASKTKETVPLKLLMIEAF